MADDAIISSLTDCESNSSESELSDDLVEEEDDGLSVASPSLFDKVEEFMRAWKPLATQLSKILPKDDVPGNIPSLITVVVQGGMGQGKSTLLNALVDQDMLPSGSGEAVTSTTMRLMYQEVSESALPYRLVTVGMSRRDTIQMFERIKECLRMRPEDDNEEFDATVSEGAKAFLASVYEGFSVDQFLATEIDELLSSPHCRLVGRPIKDYNWEDKGLSEERCLESPAAVFKELRELSGKAGKGSALTYFIDRIEIYGPFPLLKHGLVLEDSPGQGDIVSERSRKARKRATDDSSVLMIVTNIGRASNDGALINDLQKRVVTGTGRQLIVALTKADELPNGNTDYLVQDIQTRSEIDRLRETTMKQKAVSRGRKDCIEDCAKKVKLESSRTVPDKDYIAQLNERKKEHATARKRIEDARKKIERNIEHLERKQMRLAADFRSSQAKIQLCERVGSGFPHKIAHLPHIFTVGSHDYLSLIAHRPAKAQVYKNPRHTQIPALKAHLASLSEHGRIMAYIDCLRSFEDYMSQLQPLRIRIGDLRSIRMDVDLSLKRCMDGVVQVIDKLVAELAEGADIARKQSTAVLHHSVQFFLWNTLKAVFACQGEYKSKKTGITVRLNDAFVDPILQHISVSWDRSFNTEIPALLARLCREVKKKIYGPLTDTAEEYQSEAVERLLKTVSLGLADLRMSSQRMVRNAQKKLYLDGLSADIRDILSKTYADAVAVRGEGCRKRMISHLEQALTEHGDAVFTSQDPAVNSSKGSVLLNAEAGLRRACDDLKSHLSKRVENLMHFVSRRIQGADPVVVVEETLRTVESKRKEIEVLLQALEERRDVLEKALAED